MNYYIAAVIDGRQHIGTDGQALVKDAKSFRKVENRLKWFNPYKPYDEIRVYSYSNLYDESTHRLVKTIPNKNMPHFKKVEKAIKEYADVKLELRNNKMYVSNYDELDQDNKIGVLHFLQSRRDLVNGMAGNGMLNYPNTY